MIGAALLVAAAVARESLVYDRYPSGRPRRAIVVVANDAHSGEVQLLLYPDSADATPEVLDRDEIEEGAPGNPRFQKIFDERDVVVDVVLPQDTSSSAYRVTDDGGLEEFAAGFDLVADVDGDGVPELIGRDYAGMNRCGVAEVITLFRRSGTSYASDDRKYVADVASGGPELPLLLSAAKRYVAHVYGRGAATLDGKAVRAETELRLTDGCHTLGVNGDAWAFLEERR